MTSSVASTHLIEDEEAKSLETGVGLIFPALAPSQITRSKLLRNPTGCSACAKAIVFETVKNCPVSRQGEVTSDTQCLLEQFQYYNIFKFIPRSRGSSGAVLHFFITDPETCGGWAEDFEQAEIHNPLFFNRYDGVGLRGRGRPRGTDFAYSLQAVAESHK